MILKTVSPSIISAREGSALLLALNTETLTREDHAKVDPCIKIWYKKSEEKYQNKHYSVKESAHQKEKS